MANSQVNHLVKLVQRALRAPVVTATSVILSSNEIQNGGIPVLAYPVVLEKLFWKMAV